jgi:hypothetical protein
MPRLGCSSADWAAQSCTWAGAPSPSAQPASTGDCQELQIGCSSTQKTPSAAAVLIQLSKNPDMGACRCIYSFGRRHSRLLRQWYALGTAAAGLLAVSACLIFLQELWHAALWVQQVLALPCPPPEPPPGLAASLKQHPVFACCKVHAAQSQPLATMRRL